MDDASDNPRPAFLTTREVAELLRVKERKVYDLAAAGEIPHRRITGKLLFPAAEIAAWVEGTGAPVSADRPAVVTGSHDPLLDWAVRESGAALATLFNGSRDGLEVFCGGGAALAGLHLPEAGGAWNVGSVAVKGPGNAVLLGWATRRRGLLLADSVRHDVGSMADLRGRRVAMRQPGAGAAALFETLLADAGLCADDIVVGEGFARTESDAAAAVAAGEADAAMGIESMARRFRLGFVPLVDERFDLLIDRKAYFSEPVQRLLDFARSPEFGAKAAAMGGYDIGDIGTVRWVSA